MTAHSQFEIRLLNELKSLQIADQSGKNGSATVELDQQSVGRLSRMDALQNQAMSIANERMRATRIRIVKAALSRINSGEFGFCMECGETIEERRLNADPTVPTCLECLRA